MFVALSLGHIWAVGVVVITGVAWNWGHSCTESTTLVTEKIHFTQEKYILSVDMKSCYSLLNTLCLTFLHLSPYLKHFSFASSGQLLYSSKHLLLGAGVVPLLVGVVVAVPLLVSVVSLPENVAAHIGLN